MIHQPPAGARDLLPLEVAQKGWINDCLQQVFQRWGYQRIVTSTIEWLDTLMAGGAIERSTVIQLQDTSEGTLGLRPELTASIARTAVSRMADSTYPQRICYRANVFRNPPPGYHGRQLEFYQAGVELLFAGGLLADGEILLLVADCLETLGLTDWHLILGEAGLTRSLLSVFPDPLRQQVRHCLAHLDYITLENLTYPSADLRERALLLFDLRGNPADVLSKVASLELEESDRIIVNNFKSLIHLIEQSHPNPLPLILDLSLVQTFDYYTGLVFKVVSSSDNQLRVLGQGGRYDQLLGLYHPQHQSAPGIGFSLNLEDLHLCLLSTSSSGMPRQIPVIDWLVIAQTTQSQVAAFNYAQLLRNSNTLVRVALDLGGRSPEEIRDYARTCRIKTLVWIGEDGTPRIETVQ
ncbi:histidyl-tRNA synthetase 2 [Gloeothece citriformis PCC 7424]|uniref:ATP phosphoribosyltransferase regulatory subunit n=1 Tax=Gloeothece citriformis (strain PCC 7424) TaxID=65393 RepID=HISZ_GLOC7|nr:ATP phosphoribosyltransferase regulatory subunit [Gloeothece citriformis]B7KDF3.1 RecName: Full=ATP phosphoribosyltransferase regulatory subunit [Gloeothece citriformis PCC 7424]ACK68973.1 histidyl-tRNA synthetase 2 [Gloeothece citriformis PCC 7424]